MEWDRGRDEGRGSRVSNEGNRAKPRRAAAGLAFLALGPSPAPQRKDPDARGQLVDGHDRSLGKARAVLAERVNDHLPDVIGHDAL